jgi:hypothetical protein
MIGLIQLVIYLLCIHLIYKGVEILQIAIASNKADTRGAMTLGAIMLVAAIAFAIWIGLWSEKIASQIGQAIDKLP